ncbi:Protein of uncharacterised function (DUF498/DUF598) [Delftia tsuruhatensis]|nr:Protein of uncharacterised function (DUF498/DUF598) [Delftia tsuruhatensis]CAC9678884.1 Protein of uncharacterised function (DUF498/DUF598) [Delftia tsuruhatensis]
MQHRPGPAQVATTPIARSAPAPSMKFHADKSDAQMITGYGPGWLAVDKEKFQHSLLVGAQGLRQPWDCTRFEDLTPEHFEALALLDAEVIILGSGRRNRFPPAAWLRPLMARRTGLESMDTQAACRTYNILASEGRNVVAALLLE